MKPDLAWAYGIVGCMAGDAHFPGSSGAVGSEAIRPVQADQHIRPATAEHAPRIEAPHVLHRGEVPGVPVVGARLFPVSFPWCTRVAFVPCCHLSLKPLF